jgi:PEP-CTERM motif
MMAAPWIFNSGTTSVPQPGPATPHLWQVGGFNFDLSSSIVISQSANFLNVAGTGTISGNGFDATPGNWSFTSSDSNGAPETTFGFQTQTTAVPEPSTLALLAIGAGGLVSSRKRRDNN